MDLQDSIPFSESIVGGQVHEVNILDDLPLEPGAFYVMDRGSIDLARLDTFTLCMAVVPERGQPAIKR